MKGVMINVMGRELRVAAPEGEEQQLAASVDLLNRKMKEIRDTGKVVGTERIAIMAALNIAHDLLNQSGGDGKSAASGGASVDDALVKRKMAEFENIIEKALSDQDKLF
ncbi:MAG: cell division protein ZapA [Betaproteobacteria bacterium]|nr:cell division protein ZapA [Betaproteobacteria bacterium]